MFFQHVLLSTGHVSSRAGGNHRRRLHDQDRRDRGGEDQAPDLGHGRAREVGRRERERARESERERECEKRDLGEKHCAKCVAQHYV